MTQQAVDGSWQMVEEAVFRLFEELAGKHAGDHVAIGGRLAELGWSEIEAEYPVEACELLFRAQGRSLALTDCLDRVMLAELAGVLDGSADHVMLPDLSAGCVSGSDAGRVSGIVLGPLDHGGLQRRGRTEIAECDGFHRCHGESDR